jgi:hypothetical protein
LTSGTHVLLGLGAVVTACSQALINVVEECVPAGELADDLLNRPAATSAAARM